MIECENLQNGCGNLMLVRAEGTLSEREYRVSVPQIESDFSSHNHLLVLFDLEGLEGWDNGSRWKSLKFDSRHRTDVRAVGLLGSKKWERWIRKACRPFKCPIRSFESREKALKWLLRRKAPKRKSSKHTGLPLTERVLKRLNGLGF